MNHPRPRERGPVEAVIRCASAERKPVTIRAPVSAAPLKRKLAIPEKASPDCHPRPRERGPVEAACSTTPMPVTAASIRAPVSAAPLKLHDVADAPARKEAIRAPVSAAPLKPTRPSRTSCCSPSPSAPP